MLTSRTRIQSRKVDVEHYTEIRLKRTISGTADTHELNNLNIHELNHLNIQWYLFMNWIIWIFMSWIIFVQQGNTALHLAASNASLEVVQVLINTHCDLNAQNNVSSEMTKIKYKLMTWNIRGWKHSGHSIWSCGFEVITQSIGNKTNVGDFNNSLQTRIILQ